MYGVAQRLQTGGSKNDDDDNASWEWRECGKQNSFIIRAENGTFSQGMPETIWRAGRRVKMVKIKSGL
jgi:hypothetical protein